MTVFTGVPAGTRFVIVVTGTSGTLSHSVSVAVTVSPSVAFTSGKLHWTNHLSLSKNSNAQSWTAIVSNSLSTSAYVVIRITGQSTTVPANKFDVTCGAACVDTNGNVNNAALAAGPVSVPASSSTSFSFSQTISNSFVNRVHRHRLLDHEFSVRRYNFKVRLVCSSTIDETGDERIPRTSSFVFRKHEVAVLAALLIVTGIPVFVLPTTYGDSLYTRIKSILRTSDVGPTRVLYTVREHL
jgi:hypothetical protein